MNIFRRLKNNIEYSWDNFRVRCQRFMRGYAWIDVWNMDTWFMNTVKPMLIRLRDKGVGVPMEFENNPDGWRDILSEMLSYLDLMDEGNVYESLGFLDCDSICDMTKADCEKVNKTMEDNKNRFFELFSKYFYNLWD